MTTLTVLDPARTETLDARRTSRAPRHDLPPDLLRDASNRLSIVALVSGLLWMIGTAMAHIVGITPSHHHVHDAGSMQQLEAIQLEPWTEDQAQRWWAAH
jgi:hypothetical protein